MTLKDTMTDRAEPARAGSVQRRVRRWYYVEGETGHCYAGKKSCGIYTSVSQAVDSMKEARRLLAEWHKNHKGLFWARIVRLDETRTITATKPPTPNSAAG